MTFLRWTGQHRIIGTAAALLMIGGLMLSALPSLAKLGVRQQTFSWIGLTGFGLAIPSFLGLCTFVRCPQCRTRVIWHALSREGHPHGLNGLLRATKCPSCNFGR